MKAVAWMTPYEAAFEKKPESDLSSICEWDEKVWVQVKGGTKLDGQVREG